MRFFFLALIVALPGSAVLVSPDAIEHSLQSANLVAVIEIESLKSHSDPLYQITSTARARVLEIRKTRPDGGWLPRRGDEIRIKALGGEVGDVGVVFSGYPRPYTGHRYLATLKRIKEDLFEIAGLNHGLQPLHRTRKYSRNRTDGSDGAGTGPYLYWDRSYIPVPYFISLPTFINLETFSDAVNLAFQQWRNPGDVYMEFLPMGCSTTSANLNDGINNIILVTDTWSYGSDIIALTRNFYVAGTTGRAGMIMDTDILINAVDHTFATDENPADYDVQNILTHEAGHFIGMGHEVDPKDIDATMYASAGPGEISKRSLHADDLAGLHAAYAGVGQKISQFSSLASCSVGHQTLSCLSVPARTARPGIYGWIVGVIGLALALGRMRRFIAS